MSTPAPNDDKTRTLVLVLLRAGEMMCAGFRAFLGLPSKEEEIKKRLAGRDSSTISR